MLGRCYGVINALNLNLLRTLSKLSWILDARSTSPALTTEEFIIALDRSWKADPRFNDQLCWRKSKFIGLAVSGGVDSMALALLCTRLRYSESTKHLLLRFRAFIVDHGVRCNSSSEAHSVAEILISRGIPAEVLKIEWQDTELKSLANFETLARKKRFQLLGQACYKNGITSLMLAHHQDDQVETIMMRLISGHRGVGLLGMKACSAIPECYSLYGIHESGGEIIPKPNDSNGKRLRTPQSLSIRGFNPIPETGGIRIYKPLLYFDKERLVSTCVTCRMPWVDDRTNIDPTLTIRNAIRYLYRHHSMPAALSKSSLIGLSKNIEWKIKRQTKVINHYLSKVEILLFDTSSGIIKVKFPQFSLAVENLVKNEDTMISQAVLEVLRRVITLVTPEEHVELQSLRVAVTHVFPEIYRLRQTTLLPATLAKPKQDIFTVSGVLFQSIVNKDSRARNENLSILSHTTDTDCTWLISRQPCKKKTAQNFSITISASPKDRWVLFDGRYWIKIRNACQFSNLMISFFGPDDLKPLLSQLTTQTKMKLVEILSKVAPGKLRWTLPLISLHDPDPALCKPLSLPTLGIDVPGVKKFGSWETRYKKVYTDHMNIVE